MVQRVWTLLAALSLLAGTTGCASPERRANGDEVAPEVRFEALTFQVYRGEVLEASGTAAVARMRRDTSAIAVEGISVDFPARSGREPARLVAGAGVGNASERWFRMDGGVRATQAGDVVETTRARWSGEDRLVRGEDPVTVTGRGYVLAGPGFTLDPDARTVRIDGGADLRARGESR